MGCAVRCGDSDSAHLHRKRALTFYVQLFSLASVDG